MQTSLFLYYYRVTFEVITDSDGGDFIFAMKGAVAGVEIAGVCEYVGEKFVDEGDEEELVVEHPRQMSRLQ